jgi:hypothetical protein
MKFAILRWGMLGALALGLSACATKPAATGSTPVVSQLANGSATFGADILAGAKIICTNLTTGETIVATVDPTLITHNTTNLAKAQAACALVNAVPSPATITTTPGAVVPTQPAAAPVPAATSGPASPTS